MFDGEPPSLSNLIYLIGFKVGNTVSQIARISASLRFVPSFFSVPNCIMMRGLLLPVGIYYIPI